MSWRREASRASRVLVLEPPAPGGRAKTGRQRLTGRVDDTRARPRRSPPDSAGEGCGAVLEIASAD
ncbi:MAG: hypothetical protein WKF84_28545 [Pyrinomonadaceae bacterium]